MLNKKYNFQESEKKWQIYWEKEGIYKYDEDSSKETYSIDTPPPTVSGDLHIGHIFSYTQAEMIARYQRMQGKNVYYPFGFDDNGLPTERLVEKEEGILARNLPRSEFIEKCLNITKKYEKEFKELWQSLGFSVDWSLQYETINPQVQKVSQKSFLDLVEKGKAYVKETPVLWCTHCQTSIAQAELDSIEKDTEFHTVPFMVEGKEILVATTRPELLYGCVALFIHPQDDRYKKYIGKKASVPLYDFTIPILIDQKVSMEKGTGAVMCATFGDTTDLEWYKTHNLPYKKVINSSGLIDGNVPYIHGLSIKESRKAILELLREKGLLRSSQQILHTVGIHERCSNEVEIIPSRQWFIDVLSEKERLLEASNKIKWYPASMKIRYDNWVENLKWDWCISRQRYFGVPFPLWYCINCGKIIFAREEDLPVNPLEISPNRRCSCGSASFQPEDAVFDTWATSSITPLLHGRWKEETSIQESFLPMGMRTQAHEIIRTWAFYSIVKCLYHTGQIPWKDIMICGFVLAKKGEKISKSKNNASYSPAKLIQKHSADSIRYWAANAKLGTDTFFSEEELLGSNRFLTKLWNAAKFTLMQLEDFDNRIVDVNLPVDQWILERFRVVEQNTAFYLSQYEIGAARHEIDSFFWKDYCDNYLEIVKERLYQPEKHGYANRLSAQYSLYHSFLGVLKLYAPYVPHITEEIYQAYFIKYEKINSIHRLLWNNNVIIDTSLLQCGDRILNIVAEVRKYKSENNLSLKEPMKEIKIFATSEELILLEKTRGDLQACTGAKEIRLRESNDFSIIITK